MTDFGRVAVVHDWLTGMRGGEQVLEGILDLLPDAELFTLFHFPGSVSSKIEARTIHTSRLQKHALKAADYRRLLPFFPGAVRDWDFSRFDLIVSSSHCVAKGIDAKGKPHLCYCHTPMRYIWDRFDDYFPRTRPLTRAAAASIAPWLRRWDVSTAKEVTQFVANSAFVRDRIRKYYDRDAAIVNPFVAGEFLSAPLGIAREETRPAEAGPPTEERYLEGRLQPAGRPLALGADRDDFHLVVSALVPYKKVELAIEAVRGTGRRLVVIGDGPLLGELRRRAPANVSLPGRVSRTDVISHLARARSLILPGIEDFGITPLEAMALGTPVVALAAGGVLDSVVDNVTGILFMQPDVKSLRVALDDVEAREWDRAGLRAHATRFSRERFDRELLAQLQSTR